MNLLDGKNFPVFFCVLANFFKLNLKRQSIFSVLTVVLLISACTTAPTSSTVQAQSTVPVIAASNDSFQVTPVNPPVVASTLPVHSKSVSDGQIADAVTAPLSDLNLLRAEISPVLASAMKQPYQVPSALNCDQLAHEILLLDAILGPDLDAVPTNSESDLMAQGSTHLGNAFVGALRGAFEGVIPFRNWVRKFSGAEKHSREAAAALAAGIVRRAYLKGIGLAFACQSPAAPRLLPEAQQSPAG